MGLKHMSLITAVIVFLAAGSSPPRSEAAPTRVSEKAPVETVHGSEGTDASLRVTITREGEYYVQKVQGPSAVGQGTAVKADSQAPESLERAIVEVAGQGNAMPVEIAAHQDSRFRSYVALLNVLQELNLTQVRVTMQKDDQLDVN